MEGTNEVFSDTQKQTLVPSQRFFDLWVGSVTKTSIFLANPPLMGCGPAFSELAPKLKEAQNSAQRLELVMYYSGHSDTEGLLLGPERFSYRELKKSLDTLPADVRIAILDACSSGAMTRQKGGTKRPPFMVDASNRVHGYAVLTSSSEDEAAQESDRIRASFFTHYLISGLRGAGDLSEDGRVTLNEAYHFAFHETLTRTQRTLGGAQHPALLYSNGGEWGCGDDRYKEYKSSTVHRKGYLRSILYSKHSRTTRG